MVIVASSGGLESYIRAGMICEQGENMKRHLLAIALRILAGCVQSESREVRVGVAVPLTGPTAFYGEDIKEGVEMAVDEANVQGGINGRPIDIIYEDTECPDNLKALAAFKKLHEVDR